MLRPQLPSLQLAFSCPHPRGRACRAPRLRPPSAESAQSWRRAPRPRPPRPSQAVAAAARPRARPPRAAPRGVPSPAAPQAALHTVRASPLAAHATPPGSRKLHVKIGRGATARYCRIGRWFREQPVAHGIVIWGRTDLFWLRCTAFTDWQQEDRNCWTELLLYSLVGQ